MAEQKDLVSKLADDTFQGILSESEILQTLNIISSSDQVNSKIVGSWYKIMVRKLPDFKGDVDKLDDHYYPLVKKALITKTMDALEKNRVTTFHRSTISTLRKASLYKIDILDSNGFVLGKSFVTSGISAARSALNKTPAQVIRKMDAHIIAIKELLPELSVSTQDYQRWTKDLVIISDSP